MGLRAFSRDADAYERIRGVARSRTLRFVRQGTAVLLTESALPALLRSYL
jgi:hypothetical protein